MRVFCFIIFSKKAFIKQIIILKKNVLKDLSVVGNVNLVVGRVNLAVGHVNLVVQNVNLVVGHVNLVVGHVN